LIEDQGEVAFTIVLREDEQIEIENYRLPQNHTFNQSELIKAFVDRKSVV